MSIIRTGISDTDLDVPVTSPTLNLDFANSQKLDPRITFTRGSIGTFVNKNGLIETAQANIPRFDYDPVTGECRGLLIEESRQNLLTYSASFSDASWGKFTSTISSNVTATTAPDGTNTASKLIVNIDQTATGGYISKSTSLTSGTSYTVSCFVKAAEYATFTFIFQSGGWGTTRIARFNISSGTLGTIDANVTATITSFGNGWYRCSATSAATATTTDGIQFRYSGKGDGTSGIYIWGAQVEAGAFSTSYIPTTASTVTRTTELALMTGTNFSSWYNQTEGTFFFDGTLPFITNDTITRVPFGVSNGLNFANSIYYAKASTSLTISFSVINNNVSQQSGTTGANMTSSNFKIASSVSARSIYTSLYGGIVNPSRASAAIPTVDRLSLGKEPWNAGASNPIIGCIRKFTYYPKALSPSQLRYLTQ